MNLMGKGLTWCPNQMSFPDPSVLVPFRGRTETPERIDRYGLALGAQRNQDQDWSTHVFNTTRSPSNGVSPSFDA